MQEEKENEFIEEKTKEIVEHAYRAGIDTLSAFRAMLPAASSNSRALKALRSAHREMLLTARTFIDAQIAFLDSFDAQPDNGNRKKRARKIEVREKK